MYLSASSLFPSPPYTVWYSEGKYFFYDYTGSVAGPFETQNMAASIAEAARAGAPAQSYLTYGGQSSENNGIFSTGDQRDYVQSIPIVSTTATTTQWVIYREPDGRYSFNDNLGYKVGPFSDYTSAKKFMDEYYASAYGGFGEPVTMPEPGDVGPLSGTGGTPGVYCPSIGMSEDEIRREASQQTVAQRIESEQQARAESQATLQDKINRNLEEQVAQGIITREESEMIRQNITNAQTSAARQLQAETDAQASAAWLTAQNVTTQAVAENISYPELYQEVPAGVKLPALSQEPYLDIATLMERYLPWVGGGLFLLILTAIVMPRKT
jgi:hypothetical protein